MKKYGSIVLTFTVLALALATTACTPVEKQAYRTAVAAKAFLDSEKAQHPECATNASSSTCQLLKQATAAKDALIDAAELYCASDSFEAGGTCTPPAKGTVAERVATDKLKSAIANYNQIYNDVKGAL